MAKEKGKNERLESSASYEDLNGDKEVENPKARVMKDKRGRRWSYTIRQAEEFRPFHYSVLCCWIVAVFSVCRLSCLTFLKVFCLQTSLSDSKMAGVIAEWREINRKLRYHGYQPVMVLPCSQLQQIPRGAVVLEELTSKNLRQTLSKLMTDCDRRQSMVQQLITSSHRIQKDADEERNRVYHYEMKIRNLQKEVDEENLKTQELERMRLVELQNHGEEVKELKRSMSEVVALHRQLEQKVAQKEAEITRLQQQCQDLTEMSAGKQLKDSKKLIKLLESENTCLKMELESRPNHEEWKNSRKYNREFEKRLAQNNLSPPRQKHKDKRSVKTEGCASRQRGYTTQVDGIDSLPIDVCRSYLKEVCGGLQVIDLKDILDKIHIMKLSLQSYPAMERLIKDIIDVVNSEDAPRLTTEVLSENTHEFHCEMAWLNIVPVLRMWLRELSGLKDLQASVMKLSLQLKPWKSESELKRDRSPLTVQSIREAVDILSKENRTSPSEIRTEEETSLDQLRSIVAHFQKLFDVNTIEGTFPRMSEVYMRLGESSNLMNNMRDILGLEQACRASDIINAVAKLSKAKHLLKVEDLPSIIKRLDQYDEFFPAFQSLVSELKKLLRVQEMDEILTAVTALVNFPHY